MLFSTLENSTEGHSSSSRFPSNSTFNATSYLSSYKILQTRASAAMHNDGHDIVCWARDDGIHWRCYSTQYKWWGNYHIYLSFHISSRESQPKCIENSKVGNRLVQDVVAWMVMIGLGVIIPVSADFHPLVSIWLSVSPLLWNSRGDQASSKIPYGVIHFKTGTSFLSLERWQQ